ncbi:MAG TPA: DUF1854 domain-containing protein [Chloroflexota bacterium]|nr:DUF1854 domain-containing protein [Chloroflexota bacterium]
MTTTVAEPTETHSEMDVALKDLVQQSTLSVVGATDPSKVRLFRGPHGVLRCTVDGVKSVLRAKVVRAFPISEDSHWVNVLDAKNKEVCLIEDPTQLDPESIGLVQEELERYYRVAVIERINKIDQDYRTMFWDVETDRGQRDLVIRWSADTVQWRAANELLLVDIDTNRFRVPDITRLDKHSLKQLSVIF